MRKSSNRRCYYFDSLGETIDRGCPRPASICDYYHPEEEGWETATTSIYRRKKRRTRRTPTPPAHGYRRDSGDSRRRRSYSRSRSRSPEPARRARRDSIASSIPDEAASSRSSHTAFDRRRTSLSDVSLNKSLHQPSTSSLQRSLPATIPKPSSPKTQREQEGSSLLNPTLSLPTPPVTSAGSFGAVPPPDRQPTMTTTSTTIPPSFPRAWHATSPSRSVAPCWPLERTNPSAPPAPPKDPVPMPPLQPLPTVPPALSVEVVPPKTVEPSINERRAMWEERTRILSEAELAREELAKLEEDHVYSLKIVQSPYFANLPEKDELRLKLKDELAELESKRDEAKKKHEECVEKLFKTGSWPIAPPSSIEDDVEEKHQEVVKYIQELKDTALQMSRLLGDISMFKSPPAPPLFLSADSDEDSTAMDVDNPDGRRKNLKRRRISENLDVRSGGGATLMPTHQELDEFLKRLSEMEIHISTLENDINEHGRETREEFEQLVDAKLEEFEAAREEEERQRLEEEQQQMQDLEEGITLTGEQVGELATEIGDLIMRIGNLEVDVGTSMKVRQESFEKVLEVEQLLQGYTSKREANVHTIETFEKALNAYTSRPPSPPATPLNTLPSFDYIFQNLEEPMTEALRSNLIPDIEALRKDVEDMVRTQNRELYSTLWNKITVTLQVLETIQSHINRGDIEPAQILAGNVG